MVYAQNAAATPSNLITNSKALNNDFRGVDFTFQRRMNRHWLMYGGLTLSRFRGAWAGDVNSGVGCSI